MLSLATIKNRIDALEAEESAGDSDRLGYWSAMVTWRSFALAHGDNVMDVLHTLPDGHPTRQAAATLVWFPSWAFTDVLPPPDGLWWANKVQAAFAIIIDVLLTEMHYSVQQLSSPDSMNHALSEIAEFITTGDWTEFVARMESEQEATAAQARLAQMQAEYNSLLHWAMPSPDPASAAARPDPPPIQPAAPVVETPVNGKGNVEVIYTGIDPEGSFTITTINGEHPVWRHRTYIISGEQWANIESDPHLSRRWRQVTAIHPF